MRGRGLQLLRCLGLLMGLLCMLAGCGSNGESNSTSGTVSRGRPLALQFRLSSQPLSQAASAAPGAPGFIERLAIRLQT